MTKYELPRGMRYSTLEERKKFYQEEFNLKRVGDWFGGQIKNVVYAVIIGRHTGIYPMEYEDDAATTILIDEYEDLSDLKDQIIEFRPEAVYYDRNVYDESGKILGQELAFDIDPENLTCPVHGMLEDKMKRHQGLSFCEIEFNMVKEETVKLFERLTDVFSLLRIVYSGRGFHIHVLDADVYNWSSEKRKGFAHGIKNKGFLIDEWVTSGEMRLIRLPYSLHGMVSRVVVLLDVEEVESFNPFRDRRCIPKFLCITHDD